MTKEKGYSGSLLPPMDPAEVRSSENRRDAVHEAAHGVLSAHAGAGHISLSIAIRKGCRSKIPRDRPLAFLPGAYAGYFADIEISRLSEEQARKRSATDHRLAEKLLDHEAPDKRAATSESAKNEAQALVRQFDKEIQQLADLLKAVGTISERNFEQLPFIQRIRECGRKTRA